MNSFIVRYVALPYALRGVTIRDGEGCYNVYINVRMAYNIQQQAFWHEVEHIRKKHFDSKENIETLEMIPLKGF